MTDVRNVAGVRAMKFAVVETESGLAVSLHRTYEEAQHAWEGYPIDMGVLEIVEIRDKIGYRQY